MKEPNIQFTQGDQINLIRVDTAMHPTVVKFGKRIRQIALISLIVSLSLGAFFGVGVLILKLRVKQLDDIKAKTLASITKHSTTEGLLTFLKVQSTVIEKIVTLQKPLNGPLETLFTAVPQEAVTSLSFSDEYIMTISVKAATIEDSLAIVDNLVAIYQSGKIRNLQLNSYNVSIDGDVHMSLTYIPIL